eukprot:scaffold99705_cov17-Tisochrysis_lutea.AAC.1
MSFDLPGASKQVGSSRIRSKPSKPLHSKPARHDSQMGRYKKSLDEESCARASLKQEDQGNAHLQ